MNVTIVGGGGGVGASVAFNLLMLGADHEVVLVDRRPEAVASHVMDLEQTLALGAAGSVREGTHDDAATADVLVLTASVPLRQESSRLAYLEENWAIVREVLEALPGDWGGTLIVVTNPVDPLVTLAHSVAGIERGRVLGYTINDSLRLRSGVASALGARPHAVEAWVVGEHGDMCAPLLDRVRVDGREVSLTEAHRSEAERFLRTWYTRHVGLDSGRTSTWTSGLGVARMVQALGAGADELWVASVVLDGEYGVNGVALSVPVTLGGGTLRQVLAWDLSPSEEQAMRSAAAAVREATQRVCARGRDGAPS